MNQQELMSIAQRIIHEVKAAVLATTDDHRRPCMRWMTPTILPGHPRTIYALTAPNFEKVVQVNANHEVEWMIQTRTLDEIVNLRGHMDLIDNPSLKAELLEHLGPHLHAFWQACDGPECLVLETVIEHAIYRRPMNGTKETITF